MTAPLPPLPVTDYALASLGGPYEPERITSMDGYSDEHMKAYAKLAVREALTKTFENVRSLSVSGGPTQLRQAVLDELRAMLKEYE
jgi:hypothetical protein